MCDEPVDDGLAALKFIPDWCATSKLLEKFDHALDTNDSILFYNEDLDKVTYITEQRHILAIDLDKINLDHDNNFDENDLDTVIHWSGLVNLKNAKHLKKISKVLMPIAQHPKRWQNFCISEDEKKELEPIFTEACFQCAFVVYNMEVSEHFGT